MLVGKMLILVVSGFVLFLSAQGTVTRGNMQLCKDVAESCRKCAEEIDVSTQKLKNCEAKKKELNAHLNDLRDDLDAIMKENVKLTADIDGNKNELEKCKKRTTTPKPRIETTTVSNLAPGCDVYDVPSAPKATGLPGFHVGGRQYVVDTSRLVSWDGAQKACQALGMAMLQLETVHEALAVIPQIRRFLPGHIIPGRLPFYWMGARRDDPPVFPLSYRSYKWLCGNIPFKINNGPGNAGNFYAIQNGHPFVIIYVPPKASGALWYGFPNTERRFYVCEKRIH